MIMKVAQHTHGIYPEVPNGWISKYSPHNLSHDPPEHSFSASVLHTSDATGSALVSGYDPKNCYLA